MFKTHGPRLPMSVHQLPETRTMMLNGRANSTTCAARRFANAVASIGAVMIVSLSLSGAAQADRIENNIAVFSALDKVTARISKFEVTLGQSVTFGSLKVTPRVCYSRPPTEQPKTSTFVEVDELQLDGKEQRIFTGWMFAESPGLYGVEHPTVDVWLTECQKPKTTTARRQPSSPAAGGEDGALGNGDTDGGAGDQPAAFDQEPRRRVRR